MARRSDSSKAMKQVAALVQKNKRFVMGAHECPDGDSLGSAMAMACALRKLKKDVRVMTDMVPQKYGYLPLVDLVKPTAPPDLSRRIVMLFDTPTLDRLGALKPFLDGCKNLVNIDHHVSNTLYGTVNWIDTSAASVGEQVYALLKMLRVKLDKDIATCIYTSIVTDTGKFQYSNTTQRTHRITADLLTTGLDHQRIIEHIYEDYPKEKLAMVCGALSTLKLECGGKVAWMAVSRELLQSTGATLEWADDIINYARGIKGVEAAVVFKESERDGEFKVSLRSRNPDVVDVNAIACKYSGGGHKAAAGYSICGSLDEVSQKVLADFRKIYGSSH